MALFLTSRHIFTEAGLEQDSDFFTRSEREPFRFRKLPDTSEYTVREGDTLQHIAFRFYRNIVSGKLSAAQYWYVIADFQPQPIIDPTIKLIPGQVLFVPSARTVQEEVFSPRRFDESNVT